MRITLADNLRTDTSEETAELLTEADVERLVGGLRHHHAGPRVFGGYCYFNNVAAAVEMLAAAGPVAALDIDYHHGNGNQEFFEQRKDVFTCSIHGDPRREYPYFGRRLARIECPVLICQEGGYNLEVLGACVHGLLSGLLEARAS